MAFGLIPQYNEEIDISDLTLKEVLVLAHQTARKLGWNIGLMDESGFLAYTKFSMASWSEEVKIEIAEGRMKIKSQCSGNQFVDWGKNKRNVRSFISTFEVKKALITEDIVSLQYSELEKGFSIGEEKNIGLSPLEEKGKKMNVFSMFKPVKGYAVTPILIGINILIFILMVLSGGSIVQPDGESLLLWGANFGPSTLDGEWWRLFTACFVHIGILHLLMNMYALLYIGILLEPILGTARFISAYLITGIIASGVSLYWNDFTISAGASGAIFGMYGVFLAMLTTNIIQRSARKALLTSIGVFVVYNLLNGMKGGVDNAAHIGGLISGLIVGYAYYISVIKPDNVKLKYGAIGGLSIMMIVFSGLVLSYTGSSDVLKYEKEMEQFVQLEQEALHIFSLPENTSNQEYLREINSVGIPKWKECLDLIDSFDSMDLPTAVRRRNELLREYCMVRIESYQLIYRALSEDTDAYNMEIENYNKEIEAIIDQLSV